MAVFTGAGVAIVTPFKENGEVNYEEFAKQIELQIAGETDAIIVCGTTGEASTLSHEEHLDVIRYCVKVVNGRIPVVAGTGSNCTETAVYLSQEAEKAGADAISLINTLVGMRIDLKTGKIVTKYKNPAGWYEVPNLPTFWFLIWNKAFRREFLKDLYFDALNQTMDAIKIITGYFDNLISIEQVERLFSNLSYDTGVDLNLGQKMVYTRKRVRK